MINEGDSRLHQGVNAEEILKRSRQGYIVPYMVRVLGTKERQAAWRERCHADLWDNLTPMQQNAWEAIQNGFNAVTSGISCQAKDYSKATGQGSRPDDYGAALQADYRAWADRVRHRRMKFDMIMNMLVEGMSVREASRKAQPPTSNHLARMALVTALNVWGELKGWR